MKVRCDIEGLDCPHCAAKLEGMLKDKFNDANLNFSLGSLVLDVDDGDDEEEVVAAAQRLLMTLKMVLLSIFVISQ